MAHHVVVKAFSCYEHVLTNLVHVAVFKLAEPIHAAFLSTMLVFLYDVIVLKSCEQVLIVHIFIN